MATWGAGASLPVSSRTVTMNGRAASSTCSTAATTSPCRAKRSSRCAAALPMVAFAAVTASASPSGGLAPLTPASAESNSNSFALWHLAAKSRTIRASGVSNRSGEAGTLAAPCV